MARSAKSASTARRTSTGFERRPEVAKATVSLELKAFLVVMGILLAALTAFEMMSRI